jgi:hypothetical protein
LCVGWEGGRRKEKRRKMGGKGEENQETSVRWEGDQKGKGKRKE